MDRPLLISLALSTLLLVCTVPSALGQTYDAVKGFNTTGSQSASVWTYGMENILNGAFSPLPNFSADQCNSNPSSGFFCTPSAATFGGYYFNANNHGPTIEANTSGGTITYASPAPLVFPDNVLMLAPGSNETGTPPLLVVRWTAPAAGTYTIAGTFSNLQQANTDVYVSINSVTTFSGTVGGAVPFSGGPLSTLSLNAGDTIDFIVASIGGVQNDDAVGLSATVTGCQAKGPCITNPQDGASPQSQFAAIAGTGPPGDTLSVLIGGAPVGNVVVDAEGNWEALPYVAPFGSSVTIQVQDQSSFDSSNTIAVHPTVAPPPGIVGPAITYTQLLPLHKADIFITADPSSAQVWFYGPTYTHTALYLGGDSQGTPWVAEAVTSTEAEANIFGQVRSVPLEHSLAWNGAFTMTAWHPAPPLSLSGVTRANIVAWAQNITTQGLPYGNIASMSSEVLAADALFAIESVTPTPSLLTRFNGFLTLLNSAKTSTTSFICSTLVWRAYWEGTGHTLDISTPNNMTAIPGSVLGNLPTPFRSAFIAQLASVFVVPQTFATSPKLSQIF